MGDYFRWLDKLGYAAYLGVGVVMRQTFYGHNYPLIGNDLYPNPVSITNDLYPNPVSITNDLYPKPVSITTY